MLDQDRYEVPHPAKVECTVFLLHYILDPLPGHLRELFHQPVHNPTERAQFFVNSHRVSFGWSLPTVKT